MKGETERKRVRGEKDGKREKGYIKRGICDRDKEREGGRNREIVRQKEKE